MLIFPVEGTIPTPKVEDKEAGQDGGSSERGQSQQEMALREEIYDDVASNAELTVNYFALCVASGIVAALGMNADNVAAVIGAMVIAPLLGPLLAFSFGAALGDAELLTRSARNTLIGLCTCLATAIAVGLVVEVNFDSHELMSRTSVGLDSIVLALAAGTAAALSLSSGVAGRMVGVMVAVALLPPVAAAGMFLGSGRPETALQAILLFTVNIVCIMLAAQIVFYLKGVRPRTWYEREKAEQTSRINAIALIVTLAALVAIILLTSAQDIPEIG